MFLDKVIKFVKHSKKIIKPQITSLEAITAIRGCQSEEECLRNIKEETIRLYQDEDCPTKVDVRPSSLNNAGRGVFAKTTIQPGTVVATFAGTYIPPIPVCGSPFGSEESKLLVSFDSEYIILCDFTLGGGWIDGKNYHVTYGHDVGQLINHGGGSNDNIGNNCSNNITIEPNTVPITLPGEYPMNMGVIPMTEGLPWYFSPDEDRGVVTIPSKIKIKGMAIVSLRKIKANEELFFDYSINPPNKRPKWYQPISNNDYLEKAVR